jgi:hypothetical protein
MQWIAPPDTEWVFKCGETDWFTGKVMLCTTCKRKEPDDRPAVCPNTVVIDLRPKY